MSTDCFDGAERLGRCSTGLEDVVFDCFGWSCGVVDRFGSHNGGLQSASGRIADLGE